MPFLIFYLKNLKKKTFSTNNRQTQEKEILFIQFIFLEKKNKPSVGTTENVIDMPEQSTTLKVTNFLFGNKF